MFGGGKRGKRSGGGGGGDNDIMRQALPVTEGVVDFSKPPATAEESVTASWCLGPFVIPGHQRDVVTWLGCRSCLVAHKPAPLTRT
jgi:small ligand-binding sensory domain FIST